MKPGTLIPVVNHYIHASALYLSYKNRSWGLCQLKCFTSMSHPPAMEQYELAQSLSRGIVEMPLQRQASATYYLATRFCAASHISIAVPVGDNSLRKVTLTSPTQSPHPRRLGSRLQSSYNSRSRGIVTLDHVFIRLAGTIQVSIGQSFVYRLLIWYEYVRELSTVSLVHLYEPKPRVWYMPMQPAHVFRWTSERLVPRRCTDHPLPPWFRSPYASCRCWHGIFHSGNFARHTSSLDFHWINIRLYSINFPTGRNLTFHYH